MIATQNLLTPVADSAPHTPASLLWEVDSKGQRLLDWVQTHREDVAARLRDPGAVLLRGLKVLSSRQFSQLLEAVFDAPLIDYGFRSTPRTSLRGNVYTATEYHGSETIPQHNENSYTNRWAMRLGFLCMLAADEGGETPIADSRQVLARIDPAIRDEFIERGVLYVRNYGQVDLPWSEVFQTESREEVEQYCQANGIEYEWRPNDGLRTRQKRPAIATHPDTGANVWFNQAHLFHISNVPADVQESLLAAGGEEELPRNTYFGDGAPIELSYLEHIREVYRECQVTIPWQAHDVLLLDNMLFSHGRKPFRGQRKVLVGMATPRAG